MAEQPSAVAPWAMGAAAKLLDDFFLLKLRPPQTDQQLARLIQGAVPPEVAKALEDGIAAAASASVSREMLNDWDGEKEHDATADSIAAALKLLRGD